MKAYTDLSQSKKLAEILPLDSADMKWFIPADNEGEFIEDVSLIKNKSEYDLFGKVTDWDDTPYIPCWSLAALLDVLPKEYYPIKDHETKLLLGKPKDKWCVLYWDTTGMQHGEEILGDNLIDACVEMIIKLHELKML